jgi:hypothetical protein
MKYLFYISIIVGLTACGNSESKNVEETNIDMESHEDVEIVEETPEADNNIDVASFIEGDWVKIAQGCDEDGNNCEEVGGSDWKFDGKEVFLGQASQPYEVINDTIFVNGSPYVIEKTWGDTILFHAIKTERFLKLVKK